ncbi:MAG: hypothetical protein V4506_12805 [Bacteroidota bacterium]
MNKFQIIKLCFFIQGFWLLSCSKETVQEHSFYFWRTTTHLSTTEKQALQQHHVSKLYVRFFDVDYSSETKQPQPLGVVDSLELLPKNLSLIPVVYITNRTFLNLKEPEILPLAEHILQKINGLYPNYQELQIDCDWSEKTKMNYFNFLKTIKKLSKQSLKLTATIRLHQVKYPLRNGVPPVDGGMLMFYNMGNLHTMDGPNSIFDTEIAEKYTAYIKGYALHLDVALPIFRWYVHYRNGKIIGLITKKQSPETKDTLYFYDTKNGATFNVRQPLLAHGIYYETGDVLKHEALTDEALLKAATLLKENLSQENRTVVLYDLDDININYYETKTLENVFSSFNR